MDFWNTEGQNVKQSKINALIKSDAPLEEFFKETTFMDEFYTQKPELIKILSQKKNLLKLINWIYTINPQKNFTKKENCDFAFYSFTILSTCNPEITKKIIKDINLIEKLFFVTKCDSNLYITAQGYFQSILKNFLSKMNPFMDQFIDVFLSCAKKWVFSIVDNLNQANREILKDILSNKSQKMKNLQDFFFDYFISFFFNEIFVGKENNDVEDLFENANSILMFLKKNKINFFFKKKYSENLFSNRNVANKEFSEYLYSFKMNLLTYLVSIDQFKTYKNPYIFLYSCKKFKTSNKYMFYLMQNLSLFCNFSEKEKFIKDCSSDFVQLLLEIAVEEKRKDIIHKKLFYIINNLKTFINNDKKSFDIVIAFLVSKKNKFVYPHKTKKNMNDISYNFILDVLKNIDFEKITINQLKMDLITFKGELEKIFTTLCYNDKIKSTNLLSSEEKKFVISDDFNFFGSSKIDVDDKRFHYEDDIINKKQLNKNRNNLVHNNIVEKNNNNKVFVNNEKNNVFANFNNKNTNHKKKKNDLFENFDKKNNPNNQKEFSAFDDFK